jgi:hypothetical protein
MKSRAFYVEGIDFLKKDPVKTHGEDAVERPSPLVSQNVDQSKVPSTYP